LNAIVVLTHWCPSIFRCIISRPSVYHCQH